jgi:MOSC domain-containing protein YiiM
VKVIATNISEKKLVKWKGKQIETGIYKTPVKEITLGKHDVVNDNVIERRYHGGINKACYIYSADHYEYFKKLYPNLNWSWGMFGENITIAGFNETTINVGSQYSIGFAVVEITEPREPCYKLGIRFNNQKIIKDFIQVPYCGTYVKVIKEGIVRSNDIMTLIKEANNVSIADKFMSIYKK